MGPISSNMETSVHSFISSCNLPIKNLKIPFREKKYKEKKKIMKGGRSREKK